MKIVDAIAESIAVREAGVSARTLRRFSEAGYLALHVDEQGERFYSRAELQGIFGSFQEIPSSEQDGQSMLSFADGEMGQLEVSECETEESPPSIEASIVPDSEPTPSPTPPHGETGASQASPYESLEEVAKLRNLVALQERILDLKEAELQDLRSQRDWLRARVEKLEEKGDRDQVLLLSETQAIRQLIGFQQRRSSPLRSILEWLGLASSESIRALPMNDDRSAGERSAHSGSTIIVEKAANS